jgi:glucokinase
LTRYLLADIGGTNARFALRENGVMQPIEKLAVADHAQAADAVAVFLDRHQARGTVAAAAIGVAGPVENGRCTFTNSDWVVDAAELSRTFDLPRVDVINDFESVALSLPHLRPDDLATIAPGKARQDAPCLALGPGTGLGVACLLPGPPPVAIASEGGHATLPATDQRQEAIIRRLRQQFGHVSAERALSGDGLVQLHDAIAAIDGHTVPVRDPAQVTEAALHGGCATSRAALDMFCALLGAVAGDLALAFAARGGVYIAGGIVPRFVDHLARTDFRARFTAKGRFRDYLDAIPVHVILRPDPAFVGLAACAERHAADGD